MKKTVSVFVLMLALVAGAFAQDKQGSYTKDLKLQGFDRIDMGSAFVIDIRPGSHKVVVSGDEDDVQDIEASVSGGTLKIRYKDKKGWSWSNNRKRVYVNITLPTLRALNLSGATKSTVSGFNNLDILDLDISGASSSSISVNAKRVNLDVSGASTITLNGRAKELTGEVSGATSFKAYDFSVENANIDVSGASSARLNVSENLVAEASGASSVRYKGSPKVKMNTSGASSVRSE
jgi:hypothetical protein